MTRPPRDLSLKILRALSRSKYPLSTPALTRLVRGRRCPANAAFLVLRELERLSIVRRVGRVVMGRGKPSYLWALASSCAPPARVESLPSPDTRAA